MAKKLAKYNAKRDFSKTPEPRGSARARRSSAGAGSVGRFVIQKHAASRLHYDLRLEVDGVFRSWAVTRGPSINPADKRLAVEVEDHPLSYGDFEGTIPAGEYGGGTVQVWDQGKWRTGSASAAADLKRGELKFDLHGKRLRGSWVLVRMRNASDAKRRNWLLIKHSDAAAGTSRQAEALLQTDESVISGKSLAQLATPAATAKKPLAGRGKPRVPSFIEPQLCKLVSQAPRGEAWLHEVKLDGYRLQLHVINGKATLKTRSGLDWTRRFASIAEHARLLPDCMLDGEVVALDESGAPDFGALQSALVKKQDGSLVFYAFDLLFLQQQDLRPQPLLERKRQLQALLEAPVSGALRYLDHVAGDGEAIWQSACQLKLEGVISKRAAASYTSGRGGDWVKTKCRPGHEVVIGGMSVKDGQLRSLLVGVMEDDRLRYAGRVGTGFGTDIRGEVMSTLEAAESPANPFHGPGAPRGTRDIRWLKPVLVAEIEFAGWTRDGMVRQAAFKGLRQDKPARAVRAEALSTPAAPRSARPDKSASPLESSMSHPGKILWPATAVDRAFTKRDLAEYLHAASARLLPHLQGRPCSIVRAPDGITGEQFFQRHAAVGASAELQTIKLAGDRKPYLMIDSVAALVALAQLGTLELHPGNSVPGDPETPGRLVFDLDPAPELDFTLVIDAALELRTRLRDLGLTAFCKTTGGKGLHVVVPLEKPARRSGSVMNWPSAKLFAQTLCAQMAADNPQHYLIKMSKAARRGRIFLDYLRNDRLATAVAPLSPRARPGATVSTPLEWKQVRRGLDPAQFTLSTVLPRLDKSQAWSDYDATGNSLPAAIKALLRSQRQAA